jgi:hypothetical protein
VFLTDWRLALAQLSRSLSDGVVVQMGDEVPQQRRVRKGVPYDAIISRDDASGVIPSEVVGDVLKAAVQQSPATLGEWRAAAWWLEHRHPERWAERWEDTTGL